MKKNNKILLIGGSGSLGSSILKLKLFKNIDSPPRKDLNLLNTKSIKDKINRLEFIIYFDIGISLLLLLILIYSLIPNSFSIIPIRVVKPFLGINNLINIFKSLHYILIGISMTFIVQSITLLSEYRVGKVVSSSIIKLLFYKWVLFTITSITPYVFNIDIPSIFLILSFLLLSFFWYKTLDIN